MKIIVFGATGKTGQEFINLALEQKHEIVAFVRDPDKIKINHSNLKIFQGSPLNAEEVNEALKGQDIVVSCLGGNNNEKSTIITDMIKNIVATMKLNNISRIIHIGTAGIHDEIPGFIFKIIVALFLKNAIRDHKGAANIIMNSGIDYTIARPMKLIDAEPRNDFRLSVEGIPKNGREICRADLAAFLLSTIGTDEFINKTVGIAY